jgi:hypothetical protein
VIKVVTNVACSVAFPVIFDILDKRKTCLKKYVRENIYYNFSCTELS